ncbi:MAG: hypothetical protein ACOC0E_12600 [Spirochaetota bacterium]
MKKLFLVLIVPLLFGAFFIGCEPIENGELPAEDDFQTEEPATP